MLESFRAHWIRVCPTIVTDRPQIDEGAADRSCNVRVWAV
jgi:hypothetical protein